jgi:hypothetical protein
MVRARATGINNVNQGSAAEILVMKKLRDERWIVIPTQGSKSPIDVIAYHRRKQKWWGIQVKSTGAAMIFDPTDMAEICGRLYLTPVFAYVRTGKRREVYFCMMKSGRLYHVFEDGSISHLLGADVDCRAFRQKIAIVR